MTLNNKDIINILEMISNRMIEQADYLSDLDAITGDAEHGINMRKGFSEVQLLLPEMGEHKIDQILKIAGKTIMTKTGGSAGVLYGTAFLEASKACKDLDEIGPENIAAMLRGALDGMMKRGGAQVDDKTMIDTLYPATVTFEEAVQDGLSLKECSNQATEAAKWGMEHTKDLVARKGRASYQGENSKGHQDPGATSMYYIFEQANQYINSK